MITGNWYLAWWMVDGPDRRGRTNRKWTDDIKHWYGELDRNVWKLNKYSIDPTIIDLFDETVAQID